VNEMNVSLTPTEKKILQAATEVFLEKGRRGARMAEIARRAGINKALLHYYFRSKDRLYLMVFRLKIRQFFDEIFASLPQTDDIQEFTRQLISLYIEKLYRHNQVTQFILWELAQGGEELRHLFREALHGNQTPRVQYLVEKFRTAMERGEIARCDVVHLILTLVGASLYPFIAREVVETIYPDVQVLTPEFVEQRKQEVFRIVWNGLKPRT